MKLHSVFVSINFLHDFIVDNDQQFTDTRWYLVRVLSSDSVSFDFSSFCNL